MKLPAAGAASSLGANKNIIIDTTAPGITGLNSTLADGTYSVGTVIPLAVTFDKAVNVTGTPELTLNSGGLATYTGG